jgi:excisionase family DNA binding protein
MSAYATAAPESAERHRDAQTPPASASASSPPGRSSLTRDEVMTAREVSDLLRMPVSTVYELARRGELPARLLGRTWRFLRPRLEELLAS